MKVRQLTKKEINLITLFLHPTAGAHAREIEAIHKVDSDEIEAGSGTLKEDDEI